MVATTLALLGAGAVSSVATSKKEDPTDSIKSKQAYARTGKVDE
jgi:hypothetical protein